MVALKNLLLVKNLNPVHGLREKMVENLLVEKRAPRRRERAPRKRERECLLKREELLKEKDRLPNVC